MNIAWPPPYTCPKDRAIHLYCDFHAHSRKYNMFMYGCENRKRSQKYLREQVFPLLLHKNAKDRFNFEDCRFTLSRSKESTGRIVLRNMGIVNSYTLEASYGGSNVGNKVIFLTIFQLVFEQNCGALAEKKGTVIFQCFKF